MQAWPNGASVDLALLLHAYFGHAGGLAASRQSAHAVGVDLVAALRAEQRPLDGGARGRHGAAKERGGPWLAACPVPAVRSNA
jgi:hypothetical protein